MSSSSSSSSSPPMLAMISAAIRDSVTLQWLFFLQGNTDGCVNFHWYRRSRRGGCRQPGQEPPLASVIASFGWGDKTTRLGRKSKENRRPGCLGQEPCYGDLAKVLYGTWRVIFPRGRIRKGVCLSTQVKQHSKLEKSVKGGPSRRRANTGLRYRLPGIQVMSLWLRWLSRSSSASQRRKKSRAWFGLVADQTVTPTFAQGIQSLTVGNPY